MTDQIFHGCSSIPDGPELLQRGDYDMLLIMKVLLAKPRGFCAGVDRAVKIVEMALSAYGTPVYVRHQIVHNRRVVEDLEKKGAIFVEELSDIPGGSVVVFSAHGVPPQIKQQAQERGLKVVDAACPLVTKVHLEAARFAREGNHIIYIGHRGHPEPIGVMGEVPVRAFTLIETADEVDSLKVPDENKVALLTQTTLSVDETQETIKAVKKRFDKIRFPPKEDICYATTNRQAATKELAKQADVVLVIGSANSSNTNRLVEVAREQGKSAYRVNNAAEVDPDWLTGRDIVGITSGASAPETLVEEMVEFLKKLGAASISEVVAIDEGNIYFPPPPQLAADYANKMA